MVESFISFPQYIDNFAPLLFWETDDSIPFVMGIEAGILGSIAVEHPLTYLTGFILGIYFASIYIESKRKNLSGLIFHKMFLLGFYRLNKVFEYGLMKRWIH